MKKLCVFLILILSLAFMLANEGHEEAIEEGRQLVESEADCGYLSDGQLEAIGEYYMEQMHPGEAHDAVHKMRGIEEGTEDHKQIHVNLAKMMHCSENQMMVGGGMMYMMSGSNSGRMMPRFGMMGNYYGILGLGFFSWLLALLIITALVLLIIWIIKQIQKR